MLVIKLISLYLYNKATLYILETKDRHTVTTKVTDHMAFIVQVRANVSPPPGVQYEHLGIVY